MVAKAEDRRPLRRLVCAKALEHGDSVVEAGVRNDSVASAAGTSPFSQTFGAVLTPARLFRPRDHRMDERHHGAELRADLFDLVFLLPRARRREPGTARFVFRDPLARAFRL